MHNGDALVSPSITVRLLYHLTTPTRKPEESSPALSEREPPEHGQGTSLLSTRASTPGEWRRLMQGRLAELDDQIAKARAAREAVRHGLRCPHEDIAQCPNFNAGVTARLAGHPLSGSHRQLHNRQ